MGSLQCKDKIFPCGHRSGRLKFQVKLEFLHGEHAIIYCLRRTTWSEGGCWRMLGVVSIIELMNWCCMCFGSVGQHKTFGLAV